MTDYYALMGVEPTATHDEIKKAWRDLARKHHPDRGGDADEFNKISEAYKILSDTNKRQAYDIARSITQSVRCPCGRAKFPGQELCAWCALKVSQQESAKQAAEKRERKLREKAKRQYLRQQEKIKRDRQRRAALMKTKARPKSRTRIPRPDLGLPSADDLLSAVLAEAALKSGILDSDGEMDVHFSYNPLTGKVELTGKTVETLENIGSKLKMADYIFRHFRRFGSD
jgi:CRISPR/Cas system-associated protein Cas10 (large subunit of type III CRISPR-Cas system)